MSHHSSQTLLYKKEEIPGVNNTSSLFSIFYWTIIGQKFSNRVWLSVFFYKMWFLVKIDYADLTLKTFHWNVMPLSYRSIHEIHDTANTRANHITVYSYRLKHRTLHYTIHATAVSELLQSTVTAQYTITVLNSF